MEIVRTEDMQLVKSIIKIDYDQLTSDEDPCFDKFEPKPEDAEFYIGVVDDEVVGVAAFILKDGDWWYHPVVPTPKRHCAKQFIKRTINIKEQDLYTSIPDSLPKVKCFAEYFDFEVIGTITNGWIKNGVKYKLNIMRRKHGIRK